MSNNFNYDFQIDQPTSGPGPPPPAHRRSSGSGREDYIYHPGIGYVGNPRQSFVVEASSTPYPPPYLPPPSVRDDVVRGPYPNHAQPTFPNTTDFSTPLLPQELPTPILSTTAYAHKRMGKEKISTSVGYAPPPEMVGRPFVGEGTSQGRREGWVTHMIANSSGIINSDIYFDTINVLGTIPIVGDNVSCQVEKVSGMPFEFIGHRVQINGARGQIKNPINPNHTGNRNTMQAD